MPTKRADGKAITVSEAPAVHSPSVAQIKKSGCIFSDGSSTIREEQVASRLHQYFTDKGISPDAVNRMARAGALGQLFTNLAMRSADPLTASDVDRILAKYPMPRLINAVTYHGTELENAEINRAIADSARKNDIRRKAAGRGATRIFSIGNIDVSKVPRAVENTPVIVIGAGAAGEMSVRAMVSMGFDPAKITVIDKGGRYGGLWNQNNVVGGSINNPFDITFESIRHGPAPAPGYANQGFLRAIGDPANFSGKALPVPMAGIVTEVVPGDLNHKVKVKTGSGEVVLTAPIVINATGIGRPLPVSRPGVMTTDTPDSACIRWQQIISPKMAESYRGKMLIFIGLGNSTAEMLMQVKKFNEEGYNIDFRVITHYPRTSVENPGTEVTIGGKKYRVFRDPSVSSLTKYEGDLKEASAAYYYALGSGKIVSDVSSWHAEGNTLTLTTPSGGSSTFKYDRLFSLIGYGPDPDAMRKMGMKVLDEYTGAPATDYDGEVQRPVPSGDGARGRVYPGYFAIGAVSKTKENPNAIVLAGIMHKLYDELLTAALRSQEYNDRMAVLSSSKPRT